VEKDLNRYKSLTFWIGGIGRAFWSRDSIDIFCSVLQRDRIKKLYKVQNQSPVAIVKFCL